MNSRLTDPASHLSRMRLITGLIRWNAAIGIPLGVLDDAFVLVVRRKNRPQEAQGSGSHSSTEAEPFEVFPRVVFSDASDQSGKAVSFTIFGLSNNEEMGEGHFPGDGYYEVEPQLKARWSGGFGLRPSSVRFVEPAFQRVTLSDNNPVAQMEFSVRTRSVL